MYKVSVFFFIIISQCILAYERKYNCNMHLINFGFICEGLVLPDKAIEMSLKTIITRDDVIFHHGCSESEEVLRLLIDNNGISRVNLKLRLVKAFRPECGCVDGRCHDDLKWSLNNYEGILKSNFVRITQHIKNGRVSKSNPGCHIFTISSECKYGMSEDSVKPLRSLSYHEKKASNKNIATRIFRWFKRASEPKYLESNKCCKKLEPARYPDYMFGLCCKVGIAEMVICTEKGDKHPGVLFLGLPYQHSLLVELVDELF